MQTLKKILQNSIKNLASCVTRTTFMMNDTGSQPGGKQTTNTEKF